MKITRIKFYQAVSIYNGTKFTLITHLNMENPEVSGIRGIEILDNVGVKVLTSGDSTIITLNNIAFMSGPEPKDAPKVLKKV
jgi:hypothetical protein